MQTCRNSLGPSFYLGISSAISGYLKLGFFFDGILRFFRQPCLVLLPQALNHIDKITIFPIQLLNAFLVALEPRDAHFMASWQLMLVLLKVLCDFLWVMLVHKADGANSCGARGSN